MAGDSGAFGGSLSLTILPVNSNIGVDIGCDAEFECVLAGLEKVKGKAVEVVNAMDISSEAAPGGCTEG